MLDPRVLVLLGLATAAPATSQAAPAAKAWASHWRGDDFGRVNALAVSAAGDTFAVGEFATNLTIVAGKDRVAPKRLASKPGPFGARTASVLAKYGPQGELRFVIPVGAEHFAASVAATPDGGAVVAGKITNLHPAGNFDAEGAPLRGDFDGFVARFDAEGKPVWLRRLAGEEQQSITDVAVLPDGRIAFAGEITGEAVFEGDPRQRAFKTQAEGHDYDLFVGAMSSEGGLDWLHVFGGPAQDQVSGLAVTPAGSIAVTGECRDMAKVVGTRRKTTLKCRGLSIANFLALWSSAGELAWARVTPGQAKDTHAAQGLAALSDGGFVVVGMFGRKIGGRPLSELVNSDPSFLDGFVVRYDAQGAAKWIRHLRGPWTEGARAAAAGADGDVWVWGNASADIDFGDGKTYEKKVPRGGENGLLLRYDADGGLLEAGLQGGKPEPQGSFPTAGTDDVTEIRPEAIAVAPDGTLRLAGSFSGAARFARGEGTLALEAQGSLDGFVVALPSN